MKTTSSIIAAAVIGTAAAPAAAAAAEMEYGGAFCNHLISTMVQAGPDAVALQIEAWGIVSVTRRPPFGIGLASVKCPPVIWWTPDDDAGGIEREWSRRD